jgi:hypothetical protein
MRQPTIQSKMPEAAVIGANLRVTDHGQAED